MKVQWKPNWIGNEKRLVLNRTYWTKGTVGDGKGYGAKLTTSICFYWWYLFIGFYIVREYDGPIIYLCILPCLPIRFHYKRSYGGNFY